MVNFPKDLSFPMVLFIDGNDRIGKTNMISKMTKYLVELSYGAIQESDIEIFHSTKSDVVKSNQFPSKLTRGEILNYIPTTKDEIFAAAHQTGMTYCYPLAVSLEQQYEKLRKKKIIIVDRGAITNAVYGLALPLYRAQIETKSEFDVNQALKQLYAYFNAFNLNTRLFLTDNFDYFNVILLPTKIEALLNIHKFDKDMQKASKKPSEPNIWEESFGMQGLIYHLMTQMQYVIGGEECATMPVEIPYRKFDKDPSKVVQTDYMSAYAKQLVEALYKGRGYYPKDTGENYLSSDIRIPQSEIVNLPYKIKYAKGVTTTSCNDTTTAYGIRLK